MATSIAAVASGMYGIWRIRLLELHSVTASMVLSKRTRYAAAIVAAVSLLMPAMHSTWAQSVPAVLPERTSPRASGAPADVALDAEGGLRGWLITSGGAPLGGIRVSAFLGDRLVGFAWSEADGRFVIPSLRGGAYRLSAGGSAALVRVWAPQTAPPGARDSALLLSGPVVRGQLQPIASLLGSPWVITGTIAAAVAIPIAIYNNRDDRPEGS